MSSSFVNQNLVSALELTQKDVSWMYNCDYDIVDSADDLAARVADWDKTTKLGWDTETTGLSPLYNQIVGMSFAEGPGRSFYIPMRHIYGKNLAPDIVWEILRKPLEECFLIAHNGKFDWKMVNAETGIRPNIRFDTMVGVYLLDSNISNDARRRELGLAYQAKKHFNIDSLTIEEILGEGNHNFSLVPIQDARYYANADTDETRRLYKPIIQGIVEKELQNICALEMSIIPLIAEMELTGVLVDQEYLSEVDLTELECALEQSVLSIAGRDVNLLSNPDLSRLLYKDLGLPDRHKGSTGKEALKSLEGRHPIIELIQEHRRVRKLQQDFLQKLRYVVAEDGRIHSEYNQIATGTGRFNSSGGFGLRGETTSVNMQQQPKGSDPNVRKGFTASPGYVWLSVDFSQIEYRILAYAAGEQCLLESYRAGVDMHTSTAAAIFGVPVSAVTSKMRKTGKTCNFGILYGISIYGLAQSLGIPVEEATNVIRDYFARLPSISALIKKTQQFALDHGYVRTAFGRIRYFPEYKNPKFRDTIKRQSVNTYVQGTAADINKIALSKIRKLLESDPIVQKYVKVLATIHDELNCEVLMGPHTGYVARKIVDTMRIERLFPGWLNFPTSCELGWNFGELFEVDPDELARVNSKESVINLITKYEEKAKEKKKKKKEEKKEQSQEQSQEARIEELKAATQLVVKNVVAPAVILKISAELSAIQLDTLESVMHNQGGKYEVFVQIQDVLFQISDMKLNPSQMVIEMLESAGFEIKVYKERKKFDTLALLG